MKHNAHWLCGISVIALVVFWSIPAWTCTEPAAEFQLDDETVPKTVQGTLYRNCENVPPEQDPEFSLQNADTEEEVPITATRSRHGLYEITFEEELEGSTTYRFSSDPECVDLGPQEPAEWTFDTTEGQELFPEQIGSWSHSAALQGEVRFPGEEQCSRVEEAIFVTFSFDPTEEAETWGRALSFETWVNGQIWEPQLGRGETVPAGASRLGWGEEQVYAVCDEEKRPESEPHANALEDDVFRVQIAARLPGTDEVWASPERNIPVQCEDDDEEESTNDSQNGGENTEEESEEEEQDEREPLQIDEEESACSHSATGGFSPGGLVLLFAALFGMCIRRTRRVPTPEDD